MGSRDSGDFDQSSHNWDHFAVELVFNCDLEDSVDVFSDFDEDWFAVQCSSSVGEVSDDVVCLRDSDKCVLVFSLSCQVDLGEDVVFDFQSFQVS